MCTFLCSDKKVTFEEWLIDLVNRHHGHITWRFSQDEPLSSIQELKRYIPGVCTALSTLWIVYHAHEGSLSNHIRSDANLDVTIWHKAGYLQQCLSTVENVKNFLMGQGMFPVLINHNVLQASSSKTVGGWSYKFVQHIQKQPPPGAIYEALVGFTQCYAIIYFRGSSSHAVSAWIGDDDASFFDPDVGEMWFDKKHNFMSFLAEYYSHLYVFCNKIDDGFEIYPFFR